MHEDNPTEKRLREIEDRLLKLEQADQRRAQTGLETLRKLAAVDPKANLAPGIAETEAAVAKTARAIAKLARKVKYRKPRRPKP